MLPAGAIKTSDATVTVTVTDIEVADSKMDVPEYILTRKITINEMVQVSVNYTQSNPDQLFYSGAFTYNNQNVEVQLFSFLEFRFRIW